VKLIKLLGKGKKEYLKEKIELERNGKNKTYQRLI
jgi:hypothetical protein